ncbi:hypothetical protein CYMTET_34659 [Cymbomonas tetramitiformis]|uniref:Prolyl 4-hydroxylase alpha subunit domain-containing protein n=1 Tax=Cymbomonas tetramitiformis TaxID=36881 RepID=A0AAE0FAQ2_9CHLO|nr:hypothetical protein CYMTET_34659 [Cymbomonas tetramitiformis]
MTIEGAEETCCLRDDVPKSATSQQLDEQQAPDVNVIRAVDKAETNLSHLLDSILCKEGICAAPSTAVTRRELHSGDLDAFVLENVLSDEECAALIENTEAMGYSFWNPSGERRDFRSADTVEVKHQRIAEDLWGRVRGLFASDVRVVKDEPRWERGMEGTWRAVGVNSDLLFAKYGAGCHFSPHTDGHTIIDFNHRSLYSLLIYLNTCSGGGSTRMMVGELDQRFIKDEQVSRLSPHFLCPLCVDMPSLASWCAISE